MHGEYIDTLRPHLAFLEPTDDVPPDTSLSDLGLDSLAVIELVLDLEERFGVEFPDDMLKSSLFRSATTLYEALATLVAAVPGRLTTTSLGVGVAR
jgi:acyl carrier protein